MAYMLRSTLMFWFIVAIVARKLHRKNKRQKEIELKIEEPEKINSQFVAVLVDAIDEVSFAPTGCMCSVIAEKWLLTSAECTPPNIIVNGNLSVWDFASTLKDTDQLVEVVDAFIYSSYQHSEQTKLKASLHNIGLLRVEKTSKINYGLLSAVDYQALSGLHGTFLGINAPKIINNSSKNETVDLQTSNGMIFKCEMPEYRPQLMCVAPKCSSKKMQTFSYSGSPLIMNEKIVGIISSADEGHIGFTPISPYLDWIYVITEFALQKTTQQF